MLSPTWPLVKVVALNDAMIGLCSDWSDRSCFTPLGIIFGAIEWTVLFAFVCIVGYCDAQIRDSLIYK